MIGEVPEWTLWTIVGLLAFLIFWGFGKRLPWNRYSDLRPANTPDS
jgi:hypothetical protein